MEINLTQLDEELKNKAVKLSVDTNGTLNNTLSPISCELKFDKVEVRRFHPASVKLSSSKGSALITQIESVDKKIEFGTVRYVLLCGKLEQIHKEFVLTLL